MTDAPSSLGLSVLLPLCLVAFVLWRLDRRMRSARDPALLLLQQQLESMRGQVSQSLEGNVRLLQEHVARATEQVNARLRENADAVRQSHHAIGERLDSAARVVGAVQKSLGGLGEATQRIYEVGKDVASLHQILRSPKLRGGFGELLLGDVLRQILPREHFELQHTFRSGEKVDAVIRIGDGLVPVDAKFPLEDFRRAIDAESDAERAKWRRAFVARVKKHIDAIADKYILPQEGTYDFALLYVPAENVYYETIIRAENDEAVQDYALERRVIPVSPGCFYAYLQAILLGLRGLRVEESARQILGLLGHLQGDLGRFREDFRIVGRHLGNAASAYDAADKRLEKLADRLASAESAEVATEPASGAAALSLVTPAKLAAKSD